jgi:hypothetical protein
MMRPSMTIRIDGETWERLQAFATPFKSSERGTPDKVIRALLDRVEGGGEPQTPSFGGNSFASPRDTA